MDNSATEPSKRKAYASCFSKGVDIGQNNSDFYSSINIMHVYENLSYIAVKKF